MSGGDPVAASAARLAGRPERVAICLDFDGTIAPIVDDPAAARPLPGVVDLLGPLADGYAAVALVSGRPATYLASHAAAPGVRYLGMYGLEEIVEGRVQVDPRLESARPAVAAAGHDLEVVPGRLVWELRPQVHSDKGDAVRRVVASSGARALLVAGDDLGDLPAFAVAGELGGGLRVAVRSAEAPAELLAAADLVVDGPEGVRGLLEHLLG
jgi:trehalose 6-phosphate phosphatase